jgi:signal transduction histidine kinase
MDVLDYLGEFNSNKNRQEVAKNISALLKAEDLIIFIKDRELNVLLPGLGFLQNIPHGKDWNSFLNSSEEAFFKGVFPYQEKNFPAIAVRGYDESVAVLIGGAPEEKEVILLKKILSILAPLLIQEQLTMVAESKGKYNAKLAEKADRLTTSLESIRKNLTKVLEENSNLLQLTKHQNEELAAANEELAASNEEILAGIDELNVTNNRLLSINSDLDNFIYTASHDLKLPVSNIEGLVNMLMKDLMKKGWEDESTNEIMGMISVSINRFKETIKDLSEIVRIGKESATRDSLINLNEVIDDVINDFHLPVLESRAQIVNEVKENAMVNFSRKNLKSIIYNLLSNAIKYKKPDTIPVVKIYFKEDTVYNILRVQDNGLGMGSNDISKIFNLFKRLHSHVEGTGIGLYIVKKIIENAGGKIEVESILGEGTTFSVFFKK